MNHNSVQPFIASIQHVFSTMMQLPVVVKEPREKTSPTTSFDVSGIIGLSGDVVGNVVLSMRMQTAEQIVALFCGTRLNSHSPDFADAIGELLNMIAGGAKAHFEGRLASMSCPTVILGQHTVARPGGVPTIAIPCYTDCGELVIEVTLKEISANRGFIASTATRSHA